MFVKLHRIIPVAAGTEGIVAVINKEEWGLLTSSYAGSCAGAFCACALPSYVSFSFFRLA
jgi:hypothetical protein